MAYTGDDYEDKHWSHNESLTELGFLIGLLLYRVKNTGMHHWNARRALNDC